MKIKCNSFCQRMLAYLLARAGEPSTWAGLVGIATGLGIKVAPQAWDSISALGLFIASALLTVSREGRNKPDNPTLPATMKGEMPEAKPAIVPPNAQGEAPLSQSARANATVDAAGEVHAPPPGETGG